MEWSEPALFDVVKIADPRGNLSVLQYPSTLPFDPMRAYWIYDVPSGMMRLGHAHYASQEVIIALAGGFDVVTQSPDGQISQFSLSRPNQGLYMPAMTWRELTNFTTNSVALVITDTIYDESDYIREKNIYDRLTINCPENDE